MYPAVYLLSSSWKVLYVPTADDLTRNQAPSNFKGAPIIRNTGVVLSGVPRDRIQPRPSTGFHNDFMPISSKRRENQEARGKLIIIEYDIKYDVKKKLEIATSEGSGPSISIIRFPHLRSSAQSSSKSLSENARTSVSYVKLHYANFASDVFLSLDLNPGSRRVVAFRTLRILPADRKLQVVSRSSRRRTKRDGLVEFYRDAANCSCPCSIVHKEWTVQTAENVSPR